MHLIVDRTSLQKALELITRVSTKHISLPVLQCVLLTVKNNTLTLQGTNLEVGIDYTIPVKTKTPGTISVSASVLLQTVSLSTQKEVVLKQDDTTLVIETPTSRSTITSIAYEDFPSIPFIEGRGQTINRLTFAAGIKTAAFAASQSSIKPELGSVYVFQKKEHSLTCVATDSFRLIEKTVPQQTIAFEQGILIPYKNALELAHSCEVFDHDPELLVSENQCTLAFNNMRITSRLTTGTFPDYESIIPKEYVTHTTFLLADLQMALKKTGIFLNKFMQLTIQVGKSKLTITSKSDTGTTVEKINTATEGDDITLSFNQRYINEILPHLADESVMVHFAGIGRPIVMEGVHDRSLRYLVMPMNK